MEPLDPRPLCEQEVYAEHRAALDATLFGPPACVVLELRDGALEPQ